MKKILLCTMAIFLLTACATNPLTGRKSLVAVKNSAIFPQAFAAYDQVLSKSEVDKTSKDAKMLQRVGERIQFAAEKFYKEAGLNNDLKDYQWEYNLIENEQLNAWAMPGGKIAFYTGILEVCQDETGVAVVMGHEINHALAKHSAEQMSQGMLAQGLLLAGNAAISDNQWRNTFNRYYPIGAQVSLLRYGRKMELDSDKAGLFLMAMAGYDPREAPKFWKRMNEKSTGQQKPPEFLSTHPNPENRIAQINQYMPEALKLYNESPFKGK